VLPSDELRIEMHRRMLRIRGFDDAARTLKAQGRLPGPMHASTGQEAAAVGACSALRADDFMTGNHRSHGHPIAKGAALGPLMAELLGKRDGVCRGKGGSMHLADFAIGSLGESGIVGAGIAIATGAALSAQLRGTDQVTLCFFGDGASNCGSFHESLNMASLWRLPVVYFCENNLYAATTPLADASSVRDIAVRAAGYGMPGAIVDGQDVAAVFETTQTAVRRARRGEGPSLIEAKTYRFCEHAEGEGIPPIYRDVAEIERWKERDPIALQRIALLEAGVLDLAGVEAVAAEVQSEIAVALRFAETSPFPDPAEAFEDLFTPAAERDPG
jgi:TPP-dependent pyruvate/acetoin dehydrogenase alpha subunit